MIPAQVSGDQVAITPDAGMLADPDTVWPVYIDPGMSGSLNRRAAVRTVFGTKYDFDGDEGVGLCSTAASSTCSSTFKSRLLWQFAGLQLLGDLEPGDISSATFSVTGTHSYSCTPAPVTLYAVADFDQSVVYPGGGYWSALQTLNIAHRSGCAAGLEPRRIEFDASAQARAVAAANTSLASFGMASDEGSMTGWKRYGWDAAFSIVYNRPPAAPANVRTTDPDSTCATGANRPYIRSTTPTLRAVLSDADGQNVYGNFDLYDASSGAFLWDPALTPPQGSGSEHALKVTAPLQENVAYQWRVNGLDGYGGVGPISTCEFVVDLHAPVTPGVRATAGQSAVYAEDATAGGLGQPGLFTFDNSGSTDVAAYKYSFGDTSLRFSIPAVSPSISFTPTSVGTQTLSVQSVDKAGWTSPVRTYRFTVDFAGRSSAWKLDEPSGTTAADVVTVNPNALTVPATTTRADGLLTDWKQSTTDKALKFVTAADSATSSRPVVFTTRPFSVSAFVKLDDADGTYTAVSQDGTQVSGFELGHRVDAACPAATSGHCWAFSVPGSDSSAAPVTVLSDVPVRTGGWAQLTGVRTADGNLRLTVCDIGTPAARGKAVPVASATQPAPSAWTAGGAFRLGAGLAAGAVTRAWHGAVSEVRTYTGEVSGEQLKVSCQNPGNLSPVLNPPPAPPAAVKNAQGADFDGNGKADVFWASQADGYWRVSYNGTTPWTVINGAPGIRTDMYRFGDINGDGKDDVFFANPWDGRWMVSYSGNTGWQTVNNAGVPNDQLALADLTGDGKADVFWNNPADNGWYISKGAVGAWERINYAPGTTTSMLRFADVDGDGKDDVFFANPADGRWLVSYGGTTGWQVVNLAGVPNDQLGLADLTGDGKADVFWVRPSDGLWFISDATVGGWRQINGAAGIPATMYQLADMNGDGRADVFFANPWDGRWMVSDAGTAGWTSVNGAAEVLPDRVAVR